MGDLAAIFGALALLAGNAFFVGAEFALISVRRTQLEPLAEQGSRRARITLGAVERVTLMMAGAQVGITACSLGLGAVGEPAVAHLIERPFEALGLPAALLHSIAFAIALAIVTFLHMVLGEMVPKNIAIAGPERAALWLGPPLVAIVTVLKPFVVALNAIANLVMRVLRVPPQEEVSSTFTSDEVSGLVAESHREGMLDADEERLLTGALEFEELTVSTVMLPRAELTVLSTDATPHDVQQATARTGYSRFPLVDADGGISGYVHVKDALTAQRRGAATIAGEFTRALTAVAGTDTLRDALRAMQSDGAHLASVTGPDGEVVGVVALEDVLEELIGQVQDAAAAPGRPD
ncbi:MAG: hemolysin family protein [Pseudonocardia sp.]